MDFITTELDLFDTDNNQWDILIKSLCDTTKEINNHSKHKYKKLSFNHNERRNLNLIEKQQYELTHSIQRRPRILKNDIRRNYANMFANIFNSGDYESMSSHVDMLYSPDFIIEQRSLYDPSFINVLRGTEEWKEHWFYMMNIAPDIVCKIKHTMLKVRADGTSSIKYATEVTGTKVISNLITTTATSNHNQETIKTIRYTDNVLDHSNNKNTTLNQYSTDYNKVSNSLTNKRLNQASFSCLSPNSYSTSIKSNVNNILTAMEAAIVAIAPSTVPDQSNSKLFQVTTTSDNDDNIDNNDIDNYIDNDLYSSDTDKISLPSNEATDNAILKNVNNLNHYNTYTTSTTTNNNYANILSEESRNIDVGFYNPVEEDNLSELLSDFIELWDIKDLDFINNTTNNNSITSDNNNNNTSNNNNNNNNENNNDNNNNNNNSNNNNNNNNNINNTTTNNNNRSNNNTNNNSITSDNNHDLYNSTRYSSTATTITTNENNSNYDNVINNTISNNSTTTNRIAKRKKNLNDEILYNTISNNNNTKTNSINKEEEKKSSISIDDQTTLSNSISYKSNIITNTLSTTTTTNNRMINDTSKSNITNNQILQSEQYQHRMVPFYCLASFEMHIDSNYHIVKLDMTFLKHIE